MACPSIHVELKSRPVIHKEIKFPVKVCLTNWLQWRLTSTPNPEVTAQIVTKEEAKKLFKLNINNTTTVQSVKVKNQVLQLVLSNGKSKVPIAINLAGSTNGNTSQFHWNQDTAQWTAEFSHLKINKVENTKQRNCSAISQNEYWLLFYTFVQWKDKQMFIWNLSPTVKYITHSSQLPQAFNTLVYSAAAGYHSLHSQFERPRTVPVDKLIDAINQLWEAIIGKGLCDIQKNTLKSKLLLMQLGPNEIQPPDGEVTFNQFCVTNIIVKYQIEFNFWQWVGEAMILTNACLSSKDNKNNAPLWENGLIAGFLPSEYTRHILRENGKIGAFVLRFSESCLGSIGPYVLTKRGVEPREVYNTKKLKAMSLAEYVMKQSELNFLIPSGVPKEDTFGKHSQQGAASKGYVQLVLKAFRSYVKPSVAQTRNERQSWDTEDENLATEQVAAQIKSPVFGLQSTEFPCTSNQVSSTTENSYVQMDTQLITQTTPTAFNFYNMLMDALMLRGLVETCNEQEAVYKQLAYLGEEQILQFNTQINQMVNNFTSWTSNNNEIDTNLSTIAFEDVLME